MINEEMLSLIVNQLFCFLLFFIKMDNPNSNPLLSLFMINSENSPQ